MEGEVVREVRSLISEPPPEGWEETEERMIYHTNESEWGSEGVPDEEMRCIKQQHVCKTPTNADCVKYLSIMKSRTIRKYQTISITDTVKGLRPWRKYTAGGHLE